MQTFRQTQIDYNPNGVATSIFKAISALFILREPELSDNECILGLLEDFTVEPIFWDGIINVPITLFRILCDYIMLKWFCYKRHPNTNKIIYGTAYFFFSVNKDCDYALKRRQSLRSMPTRASSKVEEPTAEQFNNLSWLQGNERRTVHNILQRFKKEDTFTGSLGQDIQKYFTNYEEAYQNFHFT